MCEAKNRPKFFLKILETISEPHPRLNRTHTPSFELTSFFGLAWGVNVDMGVGIRFMS